MFLKFIIPLLGGLFCINNIFALELNLDELKAWEDSLIQLYDEKCNNKLDKENEEDLEDNTLADNDVIRDYRLCLAENGGYINNGKISIEKIFEDVKDIFNFNEQDAKDAKLILEICERDKVQEESTIEDKIGVFYLCVIDRMQSTI